MRLLLGLLLGAMNAVAAPPAVTALPPAPWQVGGVYSVMLEPVDQGPAIRAEAYCFHLLKVVFIDEHDACAIIFAGRETSRERRLAQGRTPPDRRLDLRDLSEGDLAILDPMLVAVEPVTADEIRWCEGRRMMQWAGSVQRWLLEGCAAGATLPGLSTGPNGELLLPPDFELVMEHRYTPCCGACGYNSVTVVADGSVTFRDCRTGPEGEPPPSPGCGPGERLSIQRRSRLAGALCRIGFFELSDPCGDVVGDTGTTSLSVRMGGRSHRLFNACGSQAGPEIGGLHALVVVETGFTKWMVQR